MCSSCFLIGLLVLLALPTALGIRDSSLHHAVAAMFSDGSSPCHPRANSMWRPRLLRETCRNPTVDSILKQAQLLARGSCREHFRYELWNCSTTIASFNVFREVYRETAFLYALAAAAVGHAVARACSQGSISCSCENNDCGVNNVHYGRKFTRRFLRLQYMDRATQSVVLRHDCNLGLQVLKEEMHEKCKCHGLSGSCTAKTCWMSLAPFEAIVSALMDRYYQADLLVSRNAVSALAPRHAQGQLLFLEPTPGLCAATSGRQCQSVHNCATVCCGRGFYRKLIQEVRPCLCHWKQRLILHCEKCYFYKEVFICK